MTQSGAHGPSIPGGTMPALLERPKLSNAMARALHRHIMMERERKRQGELGPKGEDTWLRASVPSRHAQDRPVRLPKPEDGWELKGRSELQNC